MVKIKQVRSWPLVAWPLLFSGLGYSLLAGWLPLSFYLDTPAGLRQLTPSLALGGLYGLLVTGLFGLYVWLYGLVAQGKWHPRPWLLLLTAIAVSLPSLLVYPYNANDLFRYALRGRITAVYQDNPYRHPPDNYPSDPLLIHAGEWSSATTPYGPVWEIIAAGATHLVGEHPFALLILLKFIALASFWLTGLLIWYCARRAQGEKAVLWLFNPGLILIFGVDGHNDSLMLLWLVAGWAFWLWQGKSRPLLGSVGAFALMFLSPLTKAVGLLPLAFFWLYFVWRLDDEPEGRVRFAFYTAVVALLLTWLTFLPFGSPLLLAERLLNEASGGASFSLVALFFLFWQATGQRVTAELVSVMGNVGLLVLGGAALWLAWQVWFRGRSPWRSGADITAVYLAQAFNFRLWYAAWPFPFVLLDETPGWVTRWRWHTAVWFLYFSQLSPLITAHLWFYWLGRNHLISHALLVTLLFALSPLCAYFSASYPFIRRNYNNLGV